MRIARRAASFTSPRRRTASSETEDAKANVFIGFGAGGYYFPNAFLRLPFAVTGTVLLHVLPFMVLAALTGVIAWYFDLRLDPQMHELLGFVIGFLLIVLGNFSHANGRAPQLPG